MRTTQSIVLGLALVSAPFAAEAAKPFVTAVKMSYTRHGGPKVRMTVEGTAQDVALALRQFTQRNSMLQIGGTINAGVNHTIVFKTDKAANMTTETLRARADEFFKPIIP
jgi:hypothetical protein